MRYFIYLVLILLLISCNKEVKELKIKKDISFDKFIELIKSNDFDEIKKSKIKEHLNKKLGYEKVQSCDKVQVQECNDCNIKEELNLKIKAFTPLMLVIKSNNLDMLKYFIKKGSKVDTCLSSTQVIKHSILAYSAQEGNLKIFKYLFSLKTPP